MPQKLTPEEEEKYAGYTRLTGEQFIEVMQTGRCEGYEAEVLEYTDETDTIIIDKVIITTSIVIEQTVKTRKSVWLKDNFYTAGFHINGGHFLDTLLVDGGTFQGTFFIKGGHYNGSLSIRNGIYQENFVISGGDFIGNVWIDGGEFKEYFWITGGSFHEGFVIEGGEFHDNFWIRGGLYSKKFWINGGQYHEELWITEGRFNSTFLIDNGKFQKKFWIDGGEFKDHFWIRGGNFQGDLGINRGTFNKSIYLNGGIYKAGVHIIKTLEDTPKELKIDTLAFNLTHPELAINITNIKINGLLVKNIFNLNYFRITNMLPLEDNIEIIVENSSLNNTELIGCDFSEATLQFDNSNLMGLFYTDTIFPEQIISFEPDTSKNLEQVRDTYSQLKTVAEKQNDRESSLYFQSKANDQIFQLQKIKLRGVANPRWKYIAFWRYIATWRRLGWQKSVAAYANILLNKAINLTNYLAFWRKYWGEFLQLLLNKYSNDFGQSYLRAFVMLFVCTGILFSLYVPSVVPELEWTWNPLDIPQGLSDGIRLYGDKFFYFINPIRKMGFLCPNGTCTDVHWLAAPIDWFSRIVIFYLSYQFVQAFRKYGRR